MQELLRLPSFSLSNLGQWRRLRMLRDIWMHGMIAVIALDSLLRGRSRMIDPIYATDMIFITCHFVSYTIIHQSLLSIVNSMSKTHVQLSFSLSIIHVFEIIWMFIVNATASKNTRSHETDRFFRATLIKINVYLTPTSGTPCFSLEPSSSLHHPPTFLPPFSLFTLHQSPTSLSQMNCHITHTQL